MRWHSVLVTASSALLLAGCGGAETVTPPPRPPRIPAGVAVRLAAEADGLARLAAGSCAARDAAARFRSDVIASVNGIPTRYQEPLLSAANDLASWTATCTEAKPKREDGHKEHGKKKGHKKHEDEQ